MCRAQVLQLGPTWQFSAGTVESVVLERSALGSLHLAKPLFHQLLRTWEQGTSMSLRYLGCRRLMFIVSASNLFRISSVTATPLRPSTCAIAKPNDPPPRITPLSIGPPPESTGPSCVGYSGGIPLPSKTTRPLLRFRHFRCDTRPTSFDLCDTYGGTRHSVPPSNRKYLNI